VVHLHSAKAQLCVLHHSLPPHPTPSCGRLESPAKNPRRGCVPRRRSSPAELEAFFDGNRPPLACARYKGATLLQLYVLISGTP